MPSAAEKKTNLYERVYLSIKNSIIQGQLAPGERLREANLAEALGTSRTPVREALRKLEKEGLVVFYPSQGATVTQMNEDTLRQVFECRAVLEGLAARGAALRSTEDGLNVLEESVILAEQFNVKGDTDKVIEKNTLFHQYIAESSGNPILLQMTDQIQSQVLRYRTYITAVGLRSEFVDEHQRILNAIKARNPDDAERWMRVHILNDMTAMLQQIKSTARE